MLLIGLFLSVVLGQTALELGKSYEGTIATRRGDSVYQFFTLKLSEKLENGELILIGKSMDPRGNPNLYVSIENAKPKNQESAEIVVCESSGTDICVVPQDKIEIDVTYNIGVHCEIYCRYQLKVVYQAELIMVNSDDMEFKMKEDGGAKIISIIVDEDWNDQKILEVSVGIKNLEEMEEEFSCFLGVNYIPSSDKYYLKGIDTWSGQQVMKVKFGKPESKRFNQVYELLVWAQVGAIITVKTRIFGDIRNIELFEDIEGIVFQNETLLFKLDLSLENIQGQLQQESINIELVPFTGHAELFVNTDYQPISLDQYQWNSTEKVAQSILISNSDSIKDFYYIAVLGKERISTFSLQVQDVYSNSMLLELNKPKSGRIKKDEILQFQFIVTGSKDKNVTVNLHSKLGNSDLIVKSCSEIYSCQIDWKDIENRKMLKTYESDKLFLYSEMAGDDTIIFTYKPLANAQQNMHYHTYAAIIYANKNSNLDEHAYKIQVAVPQSHITLKENTPQKSFISKDSYNYYKFIVQNKDIVTKINFIITPIQGTVQIYCSLSQKRPTIDSFDKQGFQNILTYGGSDGDLVVRGNYYIAIYGDTASLYTITPIIIRTDENINNSGQYPWHYVQLFEGDPHYNKPEQGQVGLFKIDLSHLTNNIYELKETLHFQLIPQSGKFKVLGFDHPENDNSQALWSGTDNFQIEFDDPNYPQTLFIKIFTVGTYSSYAYSIVYKVGWKPNELVIGSSFFGYIEKDQEQGFLLSYNRQEDLIITKHAKNKDQSKLQLYISFPEADQIILTDKLTYMIKSSMLPIDHCSSSSVGIFICSIYIRVVSQETTFYSILVSRQGQSVKLIDGQPIVRSFPELSDFFNFQSVGLPTEVVVHSTTIQLQIFANILTMSEGHSVLTYPNETHYDLKSLSIHYTPSTSIFINEEQFSERLCQVKSCVVTLTIKKLDSDAQNTNSEGVYIIQQSSDALFLSVDHPLMASIDSQTIKYFQVSVPDDKLSLMIIVTPITSGDVYILVSKNQYPTMDQYGWSSMFEDQLVIEPGNSVSPLMKGNYIIGVFSYSHLEFQIQIRLGDLHYFQIYRGVPFNMELEAQGVTYLNYLHYDDKPFKVLIKNLIGKQRLFMQSYKSQGELDELLLKDIKSFEYNNNFKGYDQIIKVERTDPKYGVPCYYLVAVQALERLDFTATVMAKGDYVYLTDNLGISNEMKSGEKQYYYFQESGLFNVTVQVTVGEVQIRGAFKNYAEQLDQQDILGQVDSTIRYFNSEIEEIQTDHTYIIEIEAIKDSQYEISCIKKHQARQLFLGIPQQIFLFPNSTGLFRFINQENDRFSITVENWGQSVDDRKLKKQHPAITVMRDKLANEDIDSPHQFEKILSVDDFSTESLRYIEYKSQKGIYFVELKPQSSSHTSNLPYTITLGNSDLNILIDKRERLVMGAIGHMKKWEVLTKDEGQLFVQVQLCGGIVELYGSKEIGQLQSGQFEQKIDYVHNKQVSGTFQVDGTAPYFIGSKIVKIRSKDNKQATYTIKSAFLRASSYIPSKDLEPGFGGLLTWDLQENEFQVQFYPLRRIDMESAFSVESVSYYLVIEQKQESDDSPLNQCEMGVQQSSINLKVQGKKVQLLKQNIPNLDQFEKLAFNIHARAYVRTQNSEILELDYYYEQQVLQGENVERIKYRKAFKYLFVLFTLVGLMVIGFLYRKRWQLEKSLHLQAQDVRNVGFLDTNIEMSSN